MIQPVLAVLLAAAALSAPETIFDARLRPAPAKPSAAEEALFRSEILPSTRSAWTSRGRGPECRRAPGNTVVDIATGSFTRPGAVQRAMLYTGCTYGGGVTIGGVAIIEDGRVAAVVIYEGDARVAIAALPDIDGNGRSEILLATSGVVSIVEVGADKVTTFGQTESVAGGRAHRIAVKPGPKPAFFRETFVESGGEWKQTAALTPLILGEDKMEYEFVR